MAHDREPRHDTPRTATAPPSRPYRVLAVSLYDIELDIADRLTHMLKIAGWPRANRSFVVREALLRLDEDLLDKTSDDVLRDFVDRQARRVKPSERPADVSAPVPPSRDSGTG